MREGGGRVERRTALDAHPTRARKPRGAPSRGRLPACRSRPTSRRPTRSGRRRLRAARAAPSTLASPPRCSAARVGVRVRAARRVLDLAARPGVRHRTVRADGGAAEREPRHRRRGGGQGHGRAVRPRRRAGPCPPGAAGAGSVPRGASRQRAAHVHTAGGRAGPGVAPVQPPVADGEQDRPSPGAGPRQGTEWRFSHLQGRQSPARPGRDHVGDTDAAPQPGHDALRRRQGQQHVRALQVERRRSGIEVRALPRRRGRHPPRDGGGRLHPRPGALR